MKQVLYNVVVSYDTGVHAHHRSGLVLAENATVALDKFASVIQIPEPFAYTEIVVTRLKSGVFEF